MSTTGLVIGALLAISAALSYAAGSPAVTVLDCSILAISLASEICAAIKGRPQ